LAFHYVALAKEFRTYQPDIKRTGLAFSLLVAGILNIVILVVVFCFIRTDFSNLRGYFEDSYDRTLETYRWAIEKLRTR